MRRGPVLLALAVVSLLLLSAGLFAASEQRLEPTLVSLVGGGDGLYSPEPTAGDDSRLLEVAMERLDRRLEAHPYDFEASLLKGLLYLRKGNLDHALSELDALTERAPQFHLAHLVRGDLLLSRTRVVSDIGDSPLLANLDERGGEQLGHLRHEASVRLQAYLDSLNNTLVPRQLLGLDPAAGNAVLVDKETHRLFIYAPSGDGGPPLLLRDFYVSTGRLVGNKAVEGDLRTPEGVYFVTSYIPGSRLPALYGVGAFPTNYPNEWDRRLGKTGYGIWLHGTERVYYNRPPLDSEGCVVLTNYDFTVVENYITPGRTPVVIAEQVQWIDHDTWTQERRSVLDALEAWRLAWESNDVDRYLSHYADDFWTRGHDLASWQQYKRRVARGKEFQRIGLAGVSLFAYPPSAAEGRDMVVVNFAQSYRSNNFNSDARKRLYLAREDGQWRILYEGTQ